MRTYRRGSRYATIVALARAADAIATIDRHAPDIPGFTAWRSDLQLARSRIDRCGAIVASGLRNWHETAAGVVSATALAGGVAFGLDALGVAWLVAAAAGVVIGVYTAVLPVRAFMTVVHAYGRACWLRVLPEPVPAAEPVDAEALVSHLVSTLVRVNTELRLSKLGTAGRPGDSWWSVERAAPAASSAWQAAASIWGRVTQGWRLSDTPAVAAEVPGGDEAREAARLVAETAGHLEPLLGELSRLSTRDMVSWTARLLIARELLWRIAGALGHEAAPASPVTVRALIAETGTFVVTAAGVVVTGVFAGWPVWLAAGLAAAAAGLAAPWAVRAVQFGQLSNLHRRSLAEHGGHLGKNLRAIAQHIDMWATEAKYEAARINATVRQVRANQVAAVPWRTEAAEQVAAARAWVRETEDAMRDYTRLDGAA